MLKIAQFEFFRIYQEDGEEEGDDEDLDDTMMNDENLEDILEEMQIDGEGNTTS